jgi:hypothetical protein
MGLDALSVDGKKPGANSISIGLVDREVALAVAPISAAGGSHPKSSAMDSSLSGQTPLNTAGSPMHCSLSFRA